jgi:hypothetical protein
MCLLSRGGGGGGVTLFSFLRNTGRKGHFVKRKTFGSRPDIQSLEFDLQVQYSNRFSQEKIKNDLKQELKIPAHAQYAEK